MIGAGNLSVSLACPPDCAEQERAVVSKCRGPFLQVCWGAPIFFLISALQRYTKHYSLKISLALVQLYSPWSVLCFRSDFCYHLLPWIKPQNTRFYFPLSSSLSFALPTHGLDEHRGGAECWLHFGWEQGWEGWTMEGHRISIRQKVLSVPYLHKER